MSTKNKLKIWLLSPYHSGSHEYWANGLRKHSQHDIQLLTMTGRFWKWRMQGGAIELADQARERVAAGERPDLILTTDMVNLSSWLGLLKAYGIANHLVNVPLLLYMHENQLTYPLRPGQKLDRTYPMINWLSQLCADRVLFNSQYHLENWFDALPNLLKQYPDYKHLALIDTVRDKSMVQPVGIESEMIAPKPADATVPPLILWNQRWEYDKRPDLFFQMLYGLHDAGVLFRLAVAGENFRTNPTEFDEAKERLSDQIIHWGYAASRAEYVALLRQADLVVSTAEHEFFGISMLEAVSAGAFPLLPNRLSYPELLPQEFHAACLYENKDELLEKAKERLQNASPFPNTLCTYVHQHFNWSHIALRYDQLFEEMAL